jgi:uncharacterized protein YkwD
MPVPQMLLLFRQADLFASSPAAVLKKVNEGRARRGLPPIKSRRGTSHAR